VNNGSERTIRGVEVGFLEEGPPPKAETWGGKSRLGGGKGGVRHFYSLERPTHSCLW